MKTFLQYFNESFEIGLVEQVKIPELQQTIPAKIDSGNDAYNVLHGENIQYNGNTVKFTTVEGKTIEKQVKDLLRVGFIWEIRYADWISNFVMVKKANGRW